MKQLRIVLNHTLDREILGWNIKEVSSIDVNQAKDLVEAVLVAFSSHPRYVSDPPLVRYCAYFISRSFYISYLETGTPIVVPGMAKRQLKRKNDCEFEIHPNKRSSTSTDRSPYLIN